MDTKEKDTDKQIDSVAAKKPDDKKDEKEPKDKFYGK